MATPEELAAFDAAFQKTAEQINDAQSGPYAVAVNDLLHLSGQIETDGTIAITPTGTYAQLIALVQQASAANLSEAALKDRIEQLGETAVEIAKKVASLATIVA